MNKKTILIIALVLLGALAYGFRDGVCPFTGTRVFGGHCEMKSDDCDGEACKEGEKGACCSDKEVSEDMHKEAH